MSSIEKQKDEEVPAKDDSDTTPDWGIPCSLCGSVPTLPLTGMCGPCTFGEVDTAGGNWYGS